MRDVCLPGLRLWLLGLGAGLVLSWLSACGGGADGTAGLDARTSLQMNACPLPMEDAQALCGTLTVAENRDRADSRLITLPFVVLPARESPAAADPVLVLGGGPGISVLQSLAGLTAQQLALHPLRQRRDLVALDQRGTPLTGPLPLECPELQRDYANGERFDGEGRIAAAAKACKARLQAQGVDLAAYDSRHSARDLHDLRLLLGARRGYQGWNVVATSYGTRLALTALQDGDAGVRSLVLDGPLPPQVNALYDAGVLDALGQVLASCAAQPACERAYPALRQRFAQALERLQAQPQALPDGTPVSAHRVLAAMRARLAGGDAAQLPLAMDLISRGELALADLLLGLGQWIDLVPPTSAMYLSVMCRDESTQPPASLPAQGTGWPDAVRQAAALHGARATAVACEPWLAGQPAMAARAPARSRVPTLVTVGEFDPLTPPANARLVQQQLPQARVVVFGGQGHGLLESDLCQLEFTARFIDAPQRMADPACVPPVASTAFALP